MTVVTLLADQDIGDEMVLKGIDTSSKPLFSVSEMATFFFARSSHWVRWLENCDLKTPDPEHPTRLQTCGRPPHNHTEEEYAEHSPHWRLMLDGELLEPIRTSSNARKYDLALIEKIAHALASNGTIKVSQLRQAIRLVKIEAEIHGYLEETYSRPAPTPTEESA